ncbi:CbtA family protein [Rhodococcus sp. IEGM 1330]|uniref:CbtA family protein n=1 Tax=Rhodococcus sp. IEGM 1330 TaxID=3082225 RepID=UPI0029545337|nr:CbtA family protein [Rhodococcus sp. IEGM 1330]MDV8021404.1 CbtA family protein [Rhodococcus sp. IEGM 1330]
MPLTDTHGPTLQGTFVQLLVRGLLAGLVAGLLAGAVAYVVGEPHIDSAIAIEEAAGADAHHADAAPAAHSHGDEEALVSRDGQRVGLFLATGLAGLALGAIFASGLHYGRRLSSLPGSILALVGAGAGWLAIEAVPFFKYPANPPAVGDPETITQRTWLWLASVILGLLAVAVAVYAAKAVASHTSVAIRVGAPLLAFLVVVGIGYALLPTVNEVGADFPATLLWEFRLSSLATQATLWLTLGLGFAFLTDRAVRPVRREAVAA